MCWEEWEHTETELDSARKTKYQSKQITGIDYHDQMTSLEIMSKQQQKKNLHRERRHVCLQDGV